MHQCYLAKSWFPARLSRGSAPLFSPAMAAWPPAKAAVVLAALLGLGASGVPVGAAARFTTQIIERGPHHRVVATETTALNEQGVWETHRGRFVELATGLQALRDGQWCDAVAQFEEFAQGFVARQTQHQVILARRLEGQGTVDILTGGVRLRNTPRWLAYTDPATGQAVILAEAQATTGQLAAPDQVLYPMAFDTLAASIRYTLRRSGLEAEVLLHENPPAPDAFGLGPESTLEVWTEFYGARARVRRHLEGPTGVRETEDPEIETGALGFAPGKAFGLAAQAGPPSPLPVQRRWFQPGGQRFLIESVPHRQVEPYLRALPKAVKGAGVRPVSGRLPSRLAPAEKPAWEGLAQVPVQPARIPPLAFPLPPQSFVLDYDLRGSLANYVFQSDTTYRVIDDVILTGVTVLEGGTVIKFPPYDPYSGRLVVAGPLHCETTPYRPAILTARDDHQVGEAVSANPLSGYYGLAYLEFNVYGPVYNLQNLRIRHANEGVRAYGNSLTLQHVQFTSTQFPLNCNNTTTCLRNALFSGVACGFYGLNGADFRVEHATFEGVGNLSYQACTLALTNCLLVATGTNNNSYTGAGIYVAGSAASAFVASVGGEHYLASDTWRDVGVTNIHPGLAGELRQLTTHPPLTLATVLSQNTVLEPQAKRDVDVPDVGYHYAPLDYVSSLLPVNTNVTLTVRRGVAWAYYGAAPLDLREGSTVLSQGTPFQPNHWCNYRAVQEKYLAGESGNLSRAFFQVADNAASPATLSAQSTDFSQLADLAGGRHLFRMLTGAGVIQTGLRDCELYNTYVLANSPNRALNLGLTNNLLHRNLIELAGNLALSAPHFRNNHFYRGSAPFLGAPGGNPGSFYNNFLDGVAYAPGATALANGCNAYLNSPALPGGGNNQVLASFVFARGPLGNYYQATTTLYNQGLGTAAAAGLYHYTVRPGNLIDGTNPVSIGLHYPRVAGIYASPDGFSSTPGTGQWYYLYAATAQGLPVYAQPYYLLYPPSLYYWGGSGDFWNMVGREWQHPGTASDPSRAFLAPATGVYRVYSQTRQDNDGYGDGLRYRILRNTTVVWQDWFTLPACATSYFPFLAQGVLAAGDYLHFQANCNAYNQYDSTYWTQVIQQAPLDRLYDTDGDGIPDIFEDLNGNGVCDSGETDWNDAADMGLKVWITQPKAGSMRP